MINRLKLRNCLIDGVILPMSMLIVVCLLPGCYVYKAFVANYEIESTSNSIDYSTVYVFAINKWVKQAHDDKYPSKMLIDSATTRYLNNLRDYPYYDSLWYLDLSLFVNPKHDIAYERLVLDTVELILGNTRDKINTVSCILYHQRESRQIVLYPLIIPKSHDGPFYIHIVLGIYQEGDTIPSERIPLIIKCERKTKVRFGD